MGYTFRCDGPCGEGYDRSPAFMGEIRESFIKTSPSVLAQMFDPGETVTICDDCSELILASGVVAFCPRCGFAENAADLPPDVERCPRCEDSELSFRGVHDEEL